ncbi:helix-turn-helix domain-containing protein [Streptomyces sp. NPDC046909]|uniref:helix-turn-helix domain-containing protein n=1 Tax=Streptomyces sp. NPDC046909 TaxID=3155617 RepID=UPI0033FB0728
MKELAGRLTALDPDAGAAVRVIAYFDRLAESRAGLEALVRGAAVLAGVPARLVDVDRRVQVRVEPDGTRRESDVPPDPAWPWAALTPDGAPALWLERGAANPGTTPPGMAGTGMAGPRVAAPGVADLGMVGPGVAALGVADAGVTGPGIAAPGAAGPSVVDAVILERAAGAVRLVLDRTRGRAPVDDPALVETLLDATAPEPARLHAARRLGLDPALPSRAVAAVEGPPRIVPGRREAELPTGRLGVGPSVSVLDLPGSWAAARTALRFTAEGTAQDPGQRIVHAEELGGTALLADLVAPGAEPPPDVLALESAAATTPWLLATLHAVASTASLRAAATEVNVHHSTLQDRLVHAEHLLGWPVRTPQGRFRLQLALTMRHLARP